MHGSANRPSACPRSFRQASFHKTPPSSAETGLREMQCSWQDWILLSRGGFQAHKCDLDIVIPSRNRSSIRLFLCAVKGITFFLLQSTVTQGSLPHPNICFKGPLIGSLLLNTEMDEKHYWLLSVLTVLVQMRLSILPELWIPYWQVYGNFVFIFAQVAKEFQHA